MSTCVERGLGSGWLGVLPLNSPRLKALDELSQCGRVDGQVVVLLFEIASLAVGSVGVCH